MQQNTHLLHCHTCTQAIKTHCQWGVGFWEGGWGSGKEVVHQIRLDVATSLRGCLSEDDIAAQSLILTQKLQRGADWFWALAPNKMRCSYCGVCLQAVLCISSEQVQDLMFLRRVFILRRHEVASQRAALTSQMQDQHASTLANATRVTELASELKQNASADHQNFHRFAWSTYFGVRQTASNSNCS